MQVNPGDNLYRFVVPAVAGPARLVPLAALETGEIKASALRVAVVRGGFVLPGDGRQ